MTEYAAYFDDSGHPDDKPYVVVAGFISTEEQWLRFENQWREDLKIIGINIFQINASHEINEKYAFEEAFGAPYALAGRTIAKFINEWKSTHMKSDDKLLVFFEDGTK